jgi:hypothetical protein
MRKAERGQRMLQEREQAEPGASCSPTASASRRKNRPGGVCNSGTTGRIVHRDLPALQLGRHPPRKSAIGGDERRGLCRRLQGFAHQKRDRARLRVGRRSIEPSQARDGLRQLVRARPLVSG